MCIISKIKEYLDKKYRNNYKLNYLGMLFVLISVMALIIDFKLLLVQCKSLNLMDIFVLSDKLFNFIILGEVLYILLLLLLCQTIEFKLWKNVKRKHKKQ